MPRCFCTRTLKCSVNSLFFKKAFVFHIFIENMPNPPFTQVTYQFFWHILILLDRFQTEISNSLTVFGMLFRMIDKAGIIIFLKQLFF